MLLLLLLLFRDSLLNTSETRNRYDDEDGEDNEEDDDDEVVEVVEDEEDAREMIGRSGEEQGNESSMPLRQVACVFISAATCNAPTTIFDPNPNIHFNSIII